MQLRRDGDALVTDVEAIEVSTNPRVAASFWHTIGEHQENNYSAATVSLQRAIKDSDPASVLCVVTTTSCFAPRVPDE